MESPTVPGKLELDSIPSLRKRQADTETVRLVSVVARELHLERFQPSANNALGDAYAIARDTIVPLLRRNCLQYLRLLRWHEMIALSDAAFGTALSVNIAEETVFVGAASTRVYKEAVVEVKAKAAAGEPRHQSHGLGLQNVEVKETAKDGRPSLQESCNVHWNTKLAAAWHGQEPNVIQNHRDLSDRPNSAQLMLALFDGFASLELLARRPVNRVVKHLPNQTLTKLSHGIVLM